jgi:hypothetical protein
VIVSVSGDIEKKLSKANYDRIRVGMTLADLNGALASAPEDARLSIPPGHEEAETITWHDGSPRKITEGPREITVKLKDNKVVDKSEKGVK